MVGFSGWPVATWWQLATTAATADTSQCSVNTQRAAELYNSICWAFTTSHKMGFCSVRHSLVFSRMDMQNEVQLKLHNFQENMITSVNHQRKHSDFSDVTLISEDRQKFPVHKIILSSGSGFFGTILRSLEEDSKTDLTKPTEVSLREDSETYLKETPKQAIEEDSNTNLTVSCGRTGHSVPPYA